MAGLTTHVLDLTHGKPAAAMTVRLYRLDSDDDEPMVETMTNVDGRVDAPLLTEVTLQVGQYRLEFEVGEYFRDRGLALPEPAFLETVGIDFGVADETSHYHVPLLVSPFGYSTYRGS